MSRCSVRKDNYNQLMLFTDNKAIGVVKMLDYRNGSHGYSVKATSGLSIFQDEANKKYPDAENPYIAYLDYLISCSKKC